MAILIGTGVIAFPQGTPPAQISSASLISFLMRTVGWYRNLDEQRQAADTEDALLINENQLIANQAVQFAFEFARSEAKAAALQQEQRDAEQSETSPSDVSRSDALRKRSATLDQTIRETELEIESLRQKLLSADERQRPKLQSQIAESRSELDLAMARRDSLRSMADFVGGSSANAIGASGLPAQIETLARLVPTALAKPSVKPDESAGAEQTHPTPTAGASRAEPSGLWGLATDLVTLSRKMRVLETTLRLTDTLNQQSRELRTPLVSWMREMSRRGDELAREADSSGQAQLAEQKKEFDSLTAQFKRASASVLPLTKVGVLLDLYKRNLTTWQNSTKSRYNSELGSLIWRISILLLFLGAALGAAHLWRRTIFRYVRDPRRRYQYLLLRKIVLWCAIIVILVFSFASELSSVATFAGLITAGVAVALQNVILSIAGYFFLIGKFGIRVGDRVQVAGVTGEVVDIGLVRFHMLELLTGGEKTPSGRVVAFSNSIVFQSTAGLFKQIPGTNFVWHEVTLNVPSDGDYGSAEEKLRGAVEAVFAQYRDEIQRQHHQVEKTLTAMPGGALAPKSQLHVTPAGLEVVIRYPVDLLQADTIDDRVTRGLLEVVDRDPSLKPPGSGRPNIKLKTNLQ